VKPLTDTDIINMPWPAKQRYAVRLHNELRRVKGEHGERLFMPTIVTTTVRKTIVHKRGQRWVVTNGVSMASAPTFDGVMRLVRG
jgi:predicted metalloenzyme YecM